MKLGMQLPSRLNFGTLVALVLLSLLGLFGNYLHIELFFGVDFLFGGVAVLTTISVLGWFPGILVGAIASLYTYVLWSHPYAVVIFTCEAIVVGFLVQRKRWSLAASEVMYWFAIGIPLVCYLYHGRMGLPLFSAWAIALKQATNGLFCAFLVSAILLIPAIQRSIMRINRVPPRPLKNVLVELTIAFTFFALLFNISVDSQLARNQAEDAVYQQLRMVANNTLNQVHMWQQWDGRNTQLLADLVRTQQYPLDLVITLEASEPDFRIKHFSGKFSQPPSEFSTVRSVRDRLEQYFPIGQMPRAKRFRQSVYQWRVSPSGSSPWSLTITSSAEPQIVALEHLYSQNLLRLLAIMSFVMLLAHTTASMISQPIIRLNQVLAHLQSSYWTSVSGLTTSNEIAPQEDELRTLNPWFKDHNFPTSGHQDTGLIGATHLAIDPNHASSTTPESSPFFAISPQEQEADSIELGAHSAILEFRNLDRFIHQWVDDWRQELGTLRVRNAELNARYQATLRQLDDMAENMTQFERDALEVRQRLIAIVQYAPIAVIEWRLDRSIAVWNPAAEKLLGYAASDVLGHDLFSVIVPDREAKSMLNTWKNLMDLTGDHHSTHQTITKDGRTVVCDWFNRPVMANNGTIISIISVLQEVLL